MPRLRSLVFALALTVLVGAAVRMTPFFPGDVTVARAVQAASPGTGWAVTYTRTALPPTKWVIAAVAVVVCYALGGWAGVLLFAIALALEQTFGEASKQLFMRPRPSRELVAVVGAPGGYSFPSTFMTLHAVVLGSIWLLALEARPGRTRQVAVIVAPVLILVAWACRVVVGAHWPSDVVLTTVLCLVWLFQLNTVMQETVGRRRHAPRVRGR